MARLRHRPAGTGCRTGRLPEKQRVALQTAAERIRVFHERQKQELQGFTYTEADGTVLGQRITPLDRVGIYVPGGKAAYPSARC
jgi:histidinol dehydrogenase